MPPDRPPVPLAAEEIHVWELRLDRPPAARERLLGWLSAAERERAARFRSDLHRNRFIAARGLLRQLLGGYTASDPAELRFVAGPYGKPRLQGPGPQFNLSHSGGLAIYAFRAWAEVGVDVELLDPEVAATRVPEHFFAPAEVRHLRSLPAAIQPRAFLECWTRKEAFIKARGDGLSLALDSFTVAFGPGVASGLTWTAWSANEPACWRIADLSDEGGRHVAAVAAPGTDWRLIRRTPDRAGH